MGNEFSMELGTCCNERDTVARLMRMEAMNAEEKVTRDGGWHFGSWGEAGLRMTGHSRVSKELVPKLVQPVWSVAVTVREAKSLPLRHDPQYVVHASVFDVNLDFCEPDDFDTWPLRHVFSLGEAAGPNFVDPRILRIEPMCSTRAGSSAPSSPRWNETFNLAKSHSAIQFCAGRWVWRREDAPQQALQGRGAVVFVSVHDRSLETCRDGMAHSPCIGMALLPIGPETEVSDWFVLKDGDGSDVVGGNGCESRLFLHVRFALELLVSNEPPLNSHQGWV